MQKHPKAAPFRNCGWIHYTNVQSLILTRARGVNVFHAGHDGSEETTPPLDDRQDSPLAGSEEEIPWEMVCNSDLDYGFMLIIVEQTPLPVASPAMVHSQDPPSLISYKRKHSAAFSATASMVSTPSSASSYVRKKATTGPLALMSISDQLSDFTDAFRAGTAAEMQPRTVMSSPERKMRAMERAQELETDLDDKHLVALIGLFQTDVSAADAYLVLKRDGLCKVWVESKLSAFDDQVSRS